MTEARPEDAWYILNPDPDEYDLHDLGDIGAWPSIPEMRRARERFNEKMKGRTL